MHLATTAVMHSTRTTGSLRTAGPSQYKHHQARDHLGQAQHTAAQTHRQQPQHPGSPLAQPHQRQGQQEEQVIGAEHRVGQAAEQAGEGCGLEMQQVNQVVGLGCRRSQQGQQQQAEGQGGGGKTKASSQGGLAPLREKHRWESRSAPGWMGIRTGGRSDWTARGGLHSCGTVPALGVIPHRAFPVSFAG